ncbi:MAG: aminopeptidase P family N-terminal domain-containing protein, partial [Candidatus Acidiferrales bacterium]
MQQTMGDEGLDAFAVTHRPNIFYLTGFSGSSGILLVTARSAMLFTDPRYAIQVKQEVTAAQVE